jgi:hypothetical protein
MSFSVIKGTAYTLTYTPDVMVNNGSTQTQLRKKNPDDDYLKNIRSSLRSFEDVVSYPPNQCYIGNISPEELRNIEKPWYKNGHLTDRTGIFGEIMPQDEFYVLMKYVDVFELLKLDKLFVEKIRNKITNHPLLGKLNIKMEGIESSDIKQLVDSHQAEGLYEDGCLVGCVKQAHDTDESLSAHIMLENLATKASSVHTGLCLFDRTGIKPEEIDYIIECSEEACGDINQRGGGNFAKAIGESLGCMNATGSDLRSFCAAPAHSLVNAAALVKAGVYNNVLVIGGGAVAKLGMNGRDHVKHGMPILEDTLAGFAAIISKNDGINPEINTDFIGRHKIGTGSSPQAVMTSLIADPILAAGLTFSDIDKYSLEMQNPEITKPAGAGDVPEANYKMIAALAVMKGALEKAALPDFVIKHGMPGYATTQGHIPSGIPFIGQACAKIKEGSYKRCMIVGKGSLFLGRMTNQFDGVSFIIEKNSGAVSDKSSLDKNELKKIVANIIREAADKLSTGDYA